MKVAAPTPTTERPVLTVKEAADYLRVSEWMIWKLIREKRIKPTRIGDRVIFARTYLERYSEGR